MGHLDCSEFCKFLDAYLDGEFDRADRADFDAHVAACADCRRHLDGAIWFQRGVRGCLREHTEQPLPRAARSRIREKLRVASQPPRAVLWARRLAIPVPALAALGAVLLLATPKTGRTSVVEQVAEQHHQRLPVEVPSPEVQEIEAWFEDKVPFHVALPRFGDQVALLGGRLSRIGSPNGDGPARRAAYLVYGVGPHKMTVLVFDGHDLNLGEGAREVNGRRIAIHQIGDVRVALYRRAGLTYAVTSDLPEGEMVGLLASAF